MQNHKTEHSSLWGLREVVSHIVITMLAIAIAFALPSAAQFILYRWWPQVTADSNLLLATEIGFATFLVLFFNSVKNSMENRGFVGSAKLASLVHARSNEGWLSRWRERLLFRKLPATRDAFVLTVTGYDTFIHKHSQFRKVLESTYEIRVMLLNPVSDGARIRADSLSDERDYSILFLEEIRESIAYLRSLRRLGKKVTLKFYDHPPFWKLVFLGEYVWVQYCHGGCSVSGTPEYVFALPPKNPKRGLFIPFYMLFLEKWNESSHPEFDFDTEELVYRDPSGREITRTPFPGLSPVIDTQEMNELLQSCAFQTEAVPATL